MKGLGFMVDIKTATRKEFDALLNQKFQLDIEGHDIELSLVEVKPLPSGLREGGGFSLLWEGPQDPIVPQGTYAFQTQNKTQFEIFIVPIGQFEECVQYECVFT